MKIKFKKNWATFLTVAILSGLIFHAIAVQIYKSLLPVMIKSNTGYRMKETAVLEESAPMDKALGGFGGMGTVSADRLVIKNKYIQMTVKDLRDSFGKVDEIARDFGGYTVSSNISGDPIYFSPVREDDLGGGQTLFGSIVIKVKAEDLGSATLELKKLGKVESESENTTEVTEEHIDLNARLDNLTRQEGRYLEILSAAKTVEDMVKIEDALTRIRGEIESLKRSLDYLNKNVALATISLELSEPKSAAQPIFDWKIGETLRTIAQNLVGIFTFLIVFIGTLLPFALLSFGLWKGYQKYKANKMAQRVKDESEE